MQRVLGLLWLVGLTAGAGLAGNGSGYEGNGSLAGLSGGALPPRTRNTDIGIQLVGGSGEAGSEGGLTTAALRKAVIILGALAVLNVSGVGVLGYVGFSRRCATGDSLSNYIIFPARGP